MIFTAQKPELALVANQRDKCQILNAGYAGLLVVVAVMILARVVRKRSEMAAR